MFHKEFKSLTVKVHIFLLESIYIDPQPKYRWTLWSKYKDPPSDLNIEGPIVKEIVKKGSMLILELLGEVNIYT